MSSSSTDRAKRPKTESRLKPLRGTSEWSMASTCLLRHASATGRSSPAAKTASDLRAELAGRYEPSHRDGATAARAARLGSIALDGFGLASISAGEVFGRIDGLAGTPSSAVPRSSRRAGRQRRYESSGLMTTMARATVRPRPLRPYP